MEQAVPLAIERLEARTLLDASAVLAGGVLTVLGTPQNDRINLFQNAALGQLVVQNGGRLVGTFPSQSVQNIVIETGAGNDVARIAPDVTQPATIKGGAGNDTFFGGGGTTALIGGSGHNKLVAGPGPTVLAGGPSNDALIGGAGKDTFAGGGGHNILFNVKANKDSYFAGPNDQVVLGASTNDPPVDPGAPDFPGPGDLQLTPTDVQALLRRAAAVTPSDSAIVAIVDRQGRILGVRVEGNVDPAITSNPNTLFFAIDGAVALARTGAFFANNQAPLTSRTVQFISQSTITQQEVNSNPDLPFSSPGYGPGDVAPIQIGGHFPPKVPFTPQVDLFDIENTNRDSIILHTPNGNFPYPNPNRFNVPSAFIPPGQNITAPESYGFVVTGNPMFQGRGIGTLPGGLPLFKANSLGQTNLVGGIGVFFPGKTGFASEENSVLSSDYDPSKPDLSLVAEYVAFQTAGGALIGAAVPPVPVGGVPPVPGFTEPFGRLDLVGITLPVFGPNPTTGPNDLMALGRTLPPGNPNSGMDVPVDMAGDLYLAGRAVPTGYLVIPHAGLPSANGVQLTPQDEIQITIQAITEANRLHAAIRTPMGVPAKFIIAISDLHGNIVSLYRETDATYFSIGVAVAKARNVAYYDDPALLQPIDQVPGVPRGAAFTNRTFRYLAEPFYPEGQDGSPPGPFSILNDGGIDPTTSLGPGVPASQHQSELGYNAFNPDSNFHDPFDRFNQNGVVFFPGSMPLYKQDAQGHYILVGGLGISGDGVSQDDVDTTLASTGYAPPDPLHVDNFFYNNVRLPFVKWNPNPEG